ncbi:hypothetical protein H9Q09_22030 [Aurantimonas sp. DM33-3]|uniref:hypothetical protein n=1 Tax=Aurantimonas sp. DM33-3 TaxID=2766955 RepID=UPI00165293B7|nr:hypothetical protein [Aurantimonas sp. DM33-3]MBC6718853.1 hypothetical protein [Aurantimonas sp. DM33-3]
MYLATGPSGLQIPSGVKVPNEHYGQLISGRNPFPDSAAALLEVADGQENQLRGGLFGRKRALGISSKQ